MDSSAAMLAVVALAALAGAVLTAVALRGTYAARLASARTEADLLRERVVDLEASLAEDAETAALLGPLREALGRVETQVGSLERDRMEQFGSLRTLLARVEVETSDLGRATASLAGSLRSSTVRGAWGEVQLRRVLESAGLLARCDFEEQASGTNRHDRGVRPDVLVRLPGGKHLVIDAKAPMSAFLDAQAEELLPEERAVLLGGHATALRGHVTGLAAKDYWSAFPSTPEMVVCFVPSDAMLASALDADPGLHEWALGQRVALVGPAALMALLRTVALTWQQDALTDNATELLDLGRELHGRLATLGAHTSKLGRALASGVEAYNAMVGALESRVLVTARRMGSLGVVSEELPTPAPVTASPRVLTAHELIDAATAPEARPELDLGLAFSGPDAEVSGRRPA
jgi:DNA recombination protein RmuC